MGPQLGWNIRGECHRQMLRVAPGPELRALVGGNGNLKSPLMPRPKTMSTFDVNDVPQKSRKHQLIRDAIAEAGNFSVRQDDACVEIEVALRDEIRDRQNTVL